MTRVYIKYNIHYIIVKSTFTLLIPPERAGSLSVMRVNEQDRVRAYFSQKPDRFNERSVGIGAG